MEKLVELLKFIFIGALQGITETLPISSSGHLVIFKKLINLNVPENDLSFEILLHLGSLIAVVFFYRKIIKDVFVNFFLFIFKRDESKKADFKYAWLLVVATIPAGIFGYLFGDEIGEKLSSLLSVGIALLITSIILFIISRMERGTKDKDQITFKDAIFIGLIQAVAIIPGISRSGSTVSASLYRKLNIDNALRFSFLLFIPVALGAALIDTVDFIKEPAIKDNLVLYLISFLTSIIFTYFSLKIFIDIIKRGKLVYFSIYCLFAGTVSLFLYFII